MTAGLGEKYLVFSEDADAEEVHLELLQAYPKVQTVGGYVTFCILMYDTLLILSPQFQLRTPSNL